MKLIYSKNNRNMGFSLLELVLAIAIFSLGSFAIASMLIDSNISTRFNSERIQALFYAKEGIEAVRVVRDTSTSTFFALAPGDYYLYNDGGAWFLNGESDILDSKYTRTVNIINTPDTPADTSKTVTINITWALTPARPVSTSLTTILTDWK